MTNVVGPTPLDEALSHIRSVAFALTSFAMAIDKFRMHDLADEIHGYSLTLKTAVETISKNQEEVSIARLKDAFGFHGAILDALLEKYDGKEVNRS